MNAPILFVTSAIKGIASGIRDSYWLGIRTFVMAPLLAAFAILPEFAQHVVEISIGMFDSRAAAHSLAGNALRWDFGYVKLAGVVLCMLFTARFWAKDGSLRPTLVIPLPTLAWVIGGTAGLVGGGMALSALGQILPPAGNIPLQILSAIYQAAMLAWLTGKLIEAAAPGLRQAFTTHLPTALVMMILLAAAFAPCQALHSLNHRWATGQARGLVWALMVFDALVVGLMATATGAALYVAHRRPATWRGWA